MIPGKQILRHAQMFRDFSGEEVHSQGTLGLFPVKEDANGEGAARDRGTLGSLGGGDTSCERLLEAGEVQG